MMPSSTQIIAPFNKFDTISPDILERAINRGNEIHDLCALYAQDFPIPDVSDEIVGYFESFCNWFDGTVSEVIAVEKRLSCDTYGFTGMPDLVCRIFGSDDIVVVDYKSARTFSKGWLLQIASYAHLTGAQRCFSLRLHPDGKKAIVDENKEWQRDLAIFFNALAVWRYYHG